MSTENVKKSIRFVGYGCLCILGFLVMVWIVSYDPPPTEFEIQKQADIQACRDQGGVPIRSVWDTTVMKDCIKLEK